MPPEIRNILSDIPSALAAEVCETIAGSSAVRIERIVSRGQATPDGQWYDQQQDEWVLLISGAAGILFEGDSRVREMVDGDHLLIPAGCRHRVAWTAADRDTVWLTVHFPAVPAP